MASVPIFKKTPAVAHGLRSFIRGSVLDASDRAYDAARWIWNGAVDRRPAVIARCKDDQDVAVAVQVAREHGLPLSVRGGGHDWAGRALCEGGVVLDLSAMRAVSVDPDTGTAMVQGGATAGEVVAAASRHGLAPVTGSVKAVGMTGLTLGGGYGPLNGKHGLAVDNLISAEVVLADGRQVIASGTRNSDLYWAIRGGGGNCGVVTSSRHRLHALPSVLTGLVLFPLSQAFTVLRGYRDIVAEAPDELTVMAGIFGGPDGRPLFFLFPTWSGDLPQGEQIVARLRRLGAPVLAQVGSIAFEDALGTFDRHVVNGRYYEMRTRWLAGITGEVALMLIDAARRATSPDSVLA